jgi:hypothetical protein
MNGVTAALGGMALVLTAICETAPPAAAQIVVNVPAPEFVGGTWLNTPKNEPVMLASRKGKVTIVHFWTFG